MCTMLLKLYRYICSCELMTHTVKLLNNYWSAYTHVTLTTFLYDIEFHGECVHQYTYHIHIHTHTHTHTHLRVGSGQPCEADWERKGKKKVYIIIIISDFLLTDHS